MLSRLSCDLCFHQQDLAVPCGHMLSTLGIGCGHLLGLCDCQPVFISLVANDLECLFLLSVDLM